MQNKEVVIEQFIKTIKESPLDMKGDPLLLTKVFKVLNKKKKKRKFIQIFLVLAFVFTGLSFFIWNFYYRNDGLKESKNIIGSSIYHTPNVQSCVNTLIGLKEKNGNLSTIKSSGNSSNKSDNHFTNIKSNKSKNHQINILNRGTDAFIQINVFGMDGGEKDVLKIIEGLTKALKNNELYIDSLRQK